MFDLAQPIPSWAAGGDKGASSMMRGAMSSRPKLAYVVHTLNPGGTEKLAVEMSLAFADEFAVEVVCLDEPGVWASDVRKRGIPVRCIWRQPGFDLRAARNLADAFRDMEADIVHAHQYTPWFYSALAARHYPRPKLIFQEHGRFYPERRSLRRVCVNRWMLRKRTDRLIAVSEDIRRRLERYEGLPAETIDVIYNGVTPIEPLGEAARRAHREELGFSTEDFVVGTVGRFDAIKNLPLLVASLGSAAKVSDRVRGLLVGDGPQFDAIGALLASSGLANRVKRTGYRADARSLVQCMDLFVLASLSEGTSVALLEACAASVPVVVTAVGGNVEVVDAGATGWVVPSGSQESLSGAILEAVTMPEKRAGFAAAAKRRFHERFAFDGMIQRYRALYRELLESGQHTQRRAAA